jgi:arylsulfatase A-like enzyme
VPAGYTLDGESYAGRLTKPDDQAGRRTALYWHFPGYLGAGEQTWRTRPAGAIRDGDWKLLESFEDGQLALFNLRDDLGERTNLAEQKPEIARELQAKLSEWRKAVNAPMPTENSARQSPRKNARARNRRNRANDG